MDKTWKQKLEARRAEIVVELSKQQPLLDELAEINKMLNALEADERAAREERFKDRSDW